MFYIYLKIKNKNSKQDKIVFIAHFIDRNYVIFNINIIFKKSVPFELYYVVITTKTIICNTVNECKSRKIKCFIFS